MLGAIEQGTVLMVTNGDLNRPATVAPHYDCVCVVRAVCVSISDCQSGRLAVFLW